VTVVINLLEKVVDVDLLAGPVIPSLPRYALSEPSCPAYKAYLAVYRLARVAPDREIIEALEALTPSPFCTTREVEALVALQPNGKKGALPVDERSSLGYAKTTDGIVVIQWEYMRNVGWRVHLRYETGFHSFTMWTENVHVISRHP